MKIIKNKFIPFKGFSAMNFFGVIFQRVDCKISNATINHEAIHNAQALDFMLSKFGYILFYLWYFIEWFLKLIPCLLLQKHAYKSISFEQEAYNNERNLDYLGTRTKFNWLKYVFKLV